MADARAVTEATAWGAESDKNRSQASYYNLVTDTRIAPKEAWSYLTQRGVRADGWRLLWARS